ncbi:MAG: septum formation family protein [Nocardioidaceae bacterium]
MHRIVSGLVAALALTLVPAQTAHAAAGDPDYNKPTVGDCHNYTYEEMYAESDTTAAVPCTDSHTGKVIAVPRVPDTVAWSDTDALNRIVHKKCYPAIDAALGRTELMRALTAYNPSVFIPTKAERQQGARWIRCDVFLWRGTDLSPLPYDTAPLVPKPLTDNVRRCLNGKLYLTTCDAKHAWKATFDFNVRKGAYPNKTQMARIAGKKCSSHVAAGGFRYDPPTKEQWKAGYRVMICFSHTTS